MCNQRYKTCVPSRILSRMISTLNRNRSVDQFRQKRRTGTRLITTRLTMTNNIRGTILTRSKRCLENLSSLIRVGNSRNIQTYIHVSSRQDNMFKTLNPQMRSKYKLNTAYNNPNRTTIIIRPTGLIFRRSRNNRNKHVRNLVLTKIIRYHNRQRRQQRPTVYTFRVDT